MPPSGGTGKRDLIPRTDSTLILLPMDGSRIKWARQMDPSMVRFKKLLRSQFYYHSKKNITQTKLALTKI